MHGVQEFGAFRVGQVFGMQHVLTRVGTGCPDHDAACVPRPAQHFLIQDYVIAPLLHGVVRPVFDQVSIAVKDAHDFDAVAQKGGCRCRDHRVGRRSGTTGKEDGDAADLACSFGSWRSGVGG